MGISSGPGISIYSKHNVCLRVRYIMFVPRGQTFSVGGGVGSYNVDGHEEEGNVSGANIVVSEATSS